MMVDTNDTWQRPSKTHGITIQTSRNHEEELRKTMFYLSTIAYIATALGLQLWHDSLCEASISWERPRSNMKGLGHGANRP